jgi:hypothetical protein
MTAQQPCLFNCLYLIMLFMANVGRSSRLVRLGYGKKNHVIPEDYS